MTMKLIKMTPEKVIFEVDVNVSLANALRRSINNIPILAIDECDIYKNDSALYDEVVAHRMGLVPLKNQKLKEGETIELKVKSRGKEGGQEVFAGELGEEVVYGEIPIVELEKDQELEIVARARVGTGKEHAKFVPGLFYYKNLPKITITKEGEKHKELAELYPNVFEFDGKLKVRNAWACDLDDEDMKNYSGVSIEMTEKVIFIIESWGQIDAKDIFVEASKALKSNLSDISKALK